MRSAARCFSRASLILLSIPIFPAVKPRRRMPEKLKWHFSDSLLLVSAGFFCIRSPCVRLFSFSVLRGFLTEPAETGVFALISLRALAAKSAIFSPRRPRRKPRGNAATRRRMHSVTTVVKLRLKQQLYVTNWT